MPHMRRNALAGPWLGLLLWGAGCGEGTTAPTEVARPTFTADVLPLFQTSCGFGSGCHGTAQPAGLVPLTTTSGLDAAALLERLMTASAREPSLPRVKPGDAASSFLWHKVTGDYTGLPCGPATCGERMPQRSAALPEADVAMLERWIQQGAVLE